MGNISVQPGTKDITGATTPPSATQGAVLYNTTDKTPVVLSTGALKKIAPPSN